MSKLLKRLEQKKLLHEYTYTKAELQLKKIIIEESQAEFMKQVYDKLNNERNEIENNKETKKDIVDFPEKIKQKAKKLYREISKRTHPDKDVLGSYSDIFAEAAAAYEDNNILDLYSICEKLSIPYEIEDFEMISIKTQIEKNKELVQKIESSFIYLWTINENEKIREILINKFIRETRGKL